ncbi:hypothetical protein PR048_014388 [Dryococelus australis]|uniref:Uncharacterized protein n=1 Tax=Dryococelus australis TaxID=614101 RepID=A0ABQ9HEB3_9NEOP|nr:hypothetical protein PR048_014388 [Dryococelus australis]
MSHPTASVCSSEDCKALLSSFSLEGCLDHLWLHILKAHTFATKRFSLNCNLLTENLQEHSLIAQRQVYDYVHHYGGVEHAGVEKLCKQKKKEKEEADKRKAEKRRVQEEIKELQKKKARVLEFVLNCYRCKS